jgi:hypothetical protein
MGKTGLVVVTSIFRSLDVEGKLSTVSRKWMSVHKDAGNGCLFSRRQERKVQRMSSRASGTDLVSFLNVGNFMNLCNND